MPEDAPPDTGEIDGQTPNTHYQQRHPGARQPEQHHRRPVRTRSDARLSQHQGSYGCAPAEIVKRQAAHFYRADRGYGIGVASCMGLNASDLLKAAE
jgi:catalase